MDEEEAIESLKDRTIVCIEKNDEGLHVELDDGRTLVIIGFIGILSKEECTLQ